MIDVGTTHYLHDIYLYIVYSSICSDSLCVQCSNIILTRFSDDDVFVWISILFNLRNVTTKGNISFKSSVTNKCLKFIVVENQYVYNPKTNINYLQIKRHIIHIMIPVLLNIPT